MIPIQDFWPVWRSSRLPWVSAPGATVKPDYMANGLAEWGLLLLMSCVIAAGYAALTGGRPRAQVACNQARRRVNAMDRWNRPDYDSFTRRSAGKTSEAGGYCICRAARNSL